MLPRNVGGGALERYVVRIYRRDPADPKKIAGSVECSGGHGWKGFLSSDALVNLLVSSGGISEGRKKSPAKSGTGDALESYREILESIRKDLEGPES
jgi:hypothetical protein